MTLTSRGQIAKLNRTEATLTQPRVSNLSERTDGPPRPLREIVTRMRRTPNTKIQRLATNGSRPGPNSPSPPNPSLQEKKRATPETEQKMP